MKAFLDEWRDPNRRGATIRRTRAVKPVDDSTPTPGGLVLQMTNITPWGEEVRAVRMICRRA